MVDDLLGELATISVPEVLGRTVVCWALAASTRGLGDRRAAAATAFLQPSRQPGCPDAADPVRRLVAGQDQRGL